MSNGQRIPTVINEIVDSTVEIKPPKCILLRIVKLLLTVSEVAGLEDENDLMHFYFFLCVDEYLHGI